MSNVNVDTVGDSLMVQVVDLTDCTRGNLTCSIKEGRKQSHPRKSAEMSSQWKRNSPEKPNAGSWTRGWMKSPEKDTTSSAVMCATPPYWSDPFRKSKELSLYYSLSDKTYVTITASTTSQTTPHYQKKEDQQQEQFLDNKDHQYKYSFGFR